MTSLIFASVSHVAHVEPCDDAEEGVGGYCQDPSALTNNHHANHEDDESPTMTNHDGRMTMIGDVVRGWSRERGLNRY
jgi:hypothetical protein